MGEDCLITCGLECYIWWQGWECYVRRQEWGVMLGNRGGNVTLGGSGGNVTSGGRSGVGLEWVFFWRQGWGVRRLGWRVTLGDTEQVSGTSGMDQVQPQCFKEKL